ncbi:hypothetical protein [Mycoplasmopsis cynos]|uniref:hypothetical protein n=1 Tax=Mycoplasmopsis cynos TaxID=171284 RepID=UPI00220DC059|nr:hypothetical protein [Mycoplasmopsis cynos]UWV82426.1 hypothetical protein NW067_05535 [Mycoplasmopsis cynos]
MVVLNSNPSHKIKLEKNSSHYFSYDFKGSSDSEKLLDKKGKFGIMNLSSGMSTSNEEGISSLKVVDKTAKAMHKYWFIRTLIIELSL